MLHFLKTSGAVILLLTVSSVVSAQTVVDPGTTSPTLQAEECAYRSDGLIGECFDCGHDCDLAANKAQARIAVEKFDVGHRLITSTVYTEFTISSNSDNYENTVSSNLIYDIEWHGIWSFTTAVLNYNPSTTITLWIRDLTADKVIKTVDIHEINQASIGGLDIVEVGLGRDLGTNEGEEHLNLFRGHTYRVHLSVTTELTAYTSGVMKIDYLRLARGVWWNDLKIRVAPDLAERVTILEARVDSLEMETELLRYDLENHTHTYLTGRGQGHNNVETETSPAIILDDEIVDESELDWLSEEDENTETIPVQSVMLTNYPNPFNPTTTVQFTIPDAGHVTIEIFNTLGQSVYTILDEEISAGTHRVEFDGTELASGNYFYRLTTGKYSETRKLTLLK